MGWGRHPDHGRHFVGGKTYQVGVKPYRRSADIHILSGSDISGSAVAIPGAPIEGKIHPLAPSLDLPMGRNAFLFSKVAHA